MQALGGSNSAYSLLDQHALNPTFKTDWKSLEDFTKRLKTDHGVFTLCDIVLNHTSGDSAWIREQPEATYNCANSPHLRPACILDRAVMRLSRDIGGGMFVAKGIPKGEVSTEAHLQAARGILESHYLPKLKLEELFMVDVEATSRAFEKKLRDAVSPHNGQLIAGDGKQEKCLKVIQDPGTTMDNLLIPRKVTQFRFHIQITVG